MEAVEATRKPRRAALYWLLGMFVVPWLLGTGVYVYLQWSGAQPGTTSKGQLISPARPLVDLRLRTAAGEDYSEQDLQGRWTLLTYAANGCGEACQQNLYHMRQVRTALSKDARRVQRLLVLNEPAAVEALREVLSTETVDMTTASGSRAELEALHSQLVEAGAGGADWIYLVDPLGNLMMAYTPEQDPRGMLRDLKKLLKYSRIG